MPKFLNRKLVTVFLALAVFWLADAAYHVHAQRVAIQGQVDDLQAKVAHVDQDNQFLASASAYFKSDEYLEKQARMNLNYKLPDEQVAFIYPDNAASVSSASSSGSGLHLSDWKDWFKNLFK